MSNFSMALQKTNCFFVFFNLGVVNMQIIPIFYPGCGLVKKVILTFLREDKKNYEKMPKLWCKYGCRC